MCIETNLLLHLPLNSTTFYFFVFGATLFQYNLHYLIKKKAVDNSIRFQWSQKNKETHLLLIIGGLILIISSLFTFRLHHFIFLGILGIITLLYSQPILPFKTKKRIKDFGLLKIFTLVLMWTLVTVWFPADQASVGLLSFQLVFLRRFIFIFVLCLMFDIRDEPVDKMENIRTMPVTTGLKNSYNIAYILLGSFLAISVFQFYYNHNLIELNAMIISCFVTAFMIHFSKKNNSDIVYLAGIDGMMILQAALVIIGSI